MRCYFTTTVAKTEAIWREGWIDLYAEFGLEGVYFSTIPLDVNDGFEGDVTLCLDVLDDAFDQYDVTDELQKANGYRLFLVPAKTLNQIGHPKVYDHEYAGCSRRELLQSSRRWEAAADEPGAEPWKGESTEAETLRRVAAMRQHASEMRHAIEFFDRIGWLTPLNLQQQGNQQ
jgi:hypothetical protein